MTVPSVDDLGPLLERQPMMTDFESEAGAGREELVLVPGGTFVGYRNRVSPGELRVGTFQEPVKAMTAHHTERNFPREGGLPFPPEEDPHESYHTRAQAFKNVDYLSVKPSFGRSEWPAKQMFPHVPTVETVDKTEHDIIPPNRVRNPVDVDYSVVDLEGYDEGRTSVTTLMTVEHQEEETLGWLADNAEDDQGLGKFKVSAWVGNVVSKCVEMLLKLVRAGKIQSWGQAEAWLNSRFDKIRAKRIQKLNRMLDYALSEVSKRVKPEIDKFLAGKGMGEDGDDDVEQGMGRHRGPRHHRHHGHRGHGWGPGWGYGGPVFYEPLYIEAITERKPFVLDEDEEEKKKKEAKKKKAGMGDLGQTTTQQPLTATQTQSVTDVVVSQIATGGLTTSGAIAGAIDLAAKIALQQQQMKIAAQQRKAAEAQLAAARAAGMTFPEKVRDVLMPEDKPFYTRPLFIGGALALLAGVGYLAVKGGGDSGSYRRRRR